MTTKIDAFIARVLALIPHDVPARDRVAADLRAHLEESVAAGTPVEDAIARMGEPDLIASEVTQGHALRPARATLRLGAFLVDAMIFIPFFAIPMCHRSGCLSNNPLYFLITFVLLLIFLRIVPEWLAGRTLGKTLFGLRVQRLHGGRINFGQAVLRHISWYRPVWALIVDGMFIFIPPRHQRLADLLGQTVVVELPAELRSRRSLIIGWMLACIVIVVLTYYILFILMPLWRR